MLIWSWDAFVSAMALSLLHSLWQGAVLGLLGVALHGRLQRARPDVRCGAYSLLLLAMFAVWVGAFCSFYRAFAGSASPAAFGPGMIVFTKVPAPSVPPSDPGALSLLQPFYPALVGAWALGVCILSLRHLGGSLLLHRLCRTAAVPCPAEWRECAERLARRMGIRRKIRLHCSSRIDVPCAFGVFRSCILLPLSAMAGLTPEQAEALIAHELAHIARNDVLFNMIQVCMETAMFYHPAVRWLSAQIRIAREHHCDDLVVQTIGDRAVYARALFSLEEARASLPRLALGARGEGQAAEAHLVHRIRRVLGVSVPERGDTGARGAVALGAAAVALATFHPVHAASPLVWMRDRLAPAKSATGPNRDRVTAIATLRKNAGPRLSGGNKGETARAGGNTVKAAAAAAPRPRGNALARRNFGAPRRNSAAAPSRPVRIAVVVRDRPAVTSAPVLRWSAGASAAAGGWRRRLEVSSRTESKIFAQQDAPDLEPRPFAAMPPLPDAPADGPTRIFRTSKVPSGMNGYRIALNGVELTPDTVLQLNGVPGRFGALSPEQQELLRQAVTAVPHTDAPGAVNEQVKVVKMMKTIVATNGNQVEVESIDLAPDSAIVLNGKPGRFGDLSPDTQQQIRAVQKAIPAIIGASHRMDGFKSGVPSTFNVQIFTSRRDGQDDPS